MSDPATHQLIVAPAAGLIPARLFAPTPKGGKARARILHRADQQRPHAQSLSQCRAPVFHWCEAHGLHELREVQPVHVAAFIKELQGQFAPPTVKQHLAALRMLFDWLVTGQVIAVEPGARGARPETRRRRRARRRC